jgi:hypothetical protein
MHAGNAPDEPPEKCELLGTLHAALQVHDPANDGCGHGQASDPLVVDQRVMRPLEISGLEKVLTICPSVDEALHEPGAAGAGGDQH